VTSLDECTCGRPRDVSEAAVGEAELADDGTLLTGDQPPPDLPPFSWHTAFVGLRRRSENAVPVLRGGD
jgi:hypothetical protein